VQIEQRWLLDRRTAVGSWCGGTEVTGRREQGLSERWNKNGGKRSRERK
jgi:hypothetical protein